MQHAIENNGHNLVITIDDEERAELRELHDDDPDHFGTDDAMVDFLEPLVCNSELQWINPADTGDLTDAPILGILGDETTENKGPYGAVHVGFWDGHARYNTIEQRWGYMDYQLRSPLQDLLDTGKAVFVASN